MPAFCPQCNAPNPPESRFCHRCGTALTVSDVHSNSHLTSSRETRLADIASDLKILGIDVASYSAPRIKKASVATARGARSVVRYSAPRLRSLADRMRPNRAEPTVTEAQVAGGASHPMAAHSSLHAISCPRCHQICEPGSVFCFACGLPLDDESPTLSAPATPIGRPAGFWIRLWAWIFDFIILAVVQLAAIAAWPGFAEYFADSSDWHWVDALTFLISASYYTVAVSVWSTTIGKRVLGLYILRKDGSKVGPARALARYLSAILSGVLFGIGYLMIGLRSDKRGLHDLICDTMVVKR